MAEAATRPAKGTIKGSLARDSNACYLFFNVSPNKFINKKITFIYVLTLFKIYIL